MTHVCFFSPFVLPPTVFLLFFFLFFHTGRKITSHSTLVPPPSPSPRPRSPTTHALGWNWNAAPFAAEACWNFTPPSFHHFFCHIFFLLFAVVSFLFTASLLSPFKLTGAFASRKMPLWPCLPSVNEALWLRRSPLSSRPHTLWQALSPRHCKHIHLADGTSATWLSV